MHNLMILVMIVLAVFFEQWYLVVGLVAFIAGWVAAATVILLKLEKAGIDTSELVTKLKASEKPKVVIHMPPVYEVEEVDGHLYAYDRKNGKFMGQAYTEESLIAKINDPSIYWLHLKAQGVAVVIKDGIVINRMPAKINKS